MERETERYPEIATKLDILLDKHIKFQSIINAIWREFDLQKTKAEAQQIVNDLEKLFPNEKAIEAARLRQRNRGAWVGSSRAPSDASSSLEPPGGETAVRAPTDRHGRNPTPGRIAAKSYVPLSTEPVPPFTGKDTNLRHKSQRPGHIGSAPARSAQRK